MGCWKPGLRFGSARIAENRFGSYFGSQSHELGKNRSFLVHNAALPSLVEVEG